MKKEDFVQWFSVVLGCCLLIFFVSFSSSETSINDNSRKIETIYFQNSEMPPIADGTEIHFFKNKYSNYSDIITSAPEIIRTEWYPDDNVKEGLTKLIIPVTFYNEKDGKWLMFRGTGDVPKLSGDHFDIDSSLNSIVAFSHLSPALTWEYSITSSERYVNYTEIKDSDAIKIINITQIKERDFTDFKPLTATDRAFLDATFFKGKKGKLDPNISNCSSLNSPNSVYTLTADILGIVGTCFTITADNITFDGQSHTVDGDNVGVDYGFDLSSVRNITIKNVMVRYFYDGIRTDLTNNSEFNSVTSSSHSDIGIYMQRSNHNKIIGSTLTSSSSGAGLYLSTSNNNTITNTTSNSNSEGFTLAGTSSSNNTFINITANLNSLGIYLQSSSRDNIFTAGTVSNNTLNNIRLLSSSNNVLTSISVLNSKKDAIYFTGSANNNNLTNLTISGTNASFYDLQFATPEINNTYIVDMAVANYSINSTGSFIFFRDSKFGEIRFLKAINGTGTNLSNDIRISNNSIFINSTISNGGFNKSTNITFYGLRTNYGNAVFVYRDGSVCTFCINFTSLNAGTVSINTTSGGNYSIDAVIKFVSPTPSDGASISSSIYVNYTVDKTTFGSDTYSLIDFNRSLVAWYRLNNESGENNTFVRDWSSYAVNNGTTTNAKVNSSGKFGGTYKFNGVSDNITIPDNDLLSPSTTGNFTVSVWMRPDSLIHNSCEGTGGSPPSCYIHWMGKGKGTGVTGQQEWVFRFYNKTTGDNRPNRISFYVFNLTGGLGAGAYVEESVTEGEWIHIVGVVNNTNVSIYKNGIWKNTQALATYGIHDGWGNGDQPMKIGTRDGNSYFNGSIDDVMIFNRALDDNEIVALYNATKTFRNYTSLSAGSYNVQAHTVNATGKVGSTEIRKITIV